MLSTLKRLWHEKSGDDTVEYALLVALIAIAMLASIYTYGLANSKPYGRAALALNGAGGSAASQASGGSGDSGSGSGGQGGSGQGGSGSSGQGGSGQGGSGSSGQGDSGQGGSAGNLPRNPTPINQPQGSKSSQ
jgi:Flp pilus assembly pilin Flp